MLREAARRRIIRALTVEPGRAGGRIEDVPLDAPLDHLVVQGLLVGACGTDREILRGRYGWPPPGRSRLVLGHESLGRVIDAPIGSGFEAGDLVAGIVRHPDPVPCESCAAGEWDACRNGRYREHGIKELDGFASEAWNLDPAMAVRVDPGLGDCGVLMEPASIAAKAWDQVERIGRRGVWTPRVALITGAGPIGLLAAMMGVQRGLDVHVLDRVTDGPKPAAVRALGAAYHHGAPSDVPAPDVVIECTGVGSVVLACVGALAASGIACLVGLASTASSSEIDATAMAAKLVLGNRVVVGSVNANKRHYEAAAESLAKAERAWLQSLITSRIPLASWSRMLEPVAHEIKQVLEIEA